LLYDILSLVQSDLNFSFTLIASTEGRYGNFDNRTQKWSGQIGMLQRREIDFSLMDLTVTLERAKVFLLSYSLMASHYFECCIISQFTYALKRGVLFRLCQSFCVANNLRLDLDFFFILLKNIF
jgi:hypothetical protein